MLTSITAVALAAVAAVGLYASISPPAAEEMAPAAATVTEPAAFSGRLEPGPCPEAWRCRPTGSFSDPRLVGEYTWEQLEMAEPGLDGSLGLVLTSVTIENDGGTWRQIPLVELAMGDFEEGPAEAYIWVGGGDYDGLVAVARPVDLDGSVGLVGHIYAGDLPFPADLRPEG